MQITKRQFPFELTRWTNQNNDSNKNNFIYMQSTHTCMYVRCLRASSKFIAADNSECDINASISCESIHLPYTIYRRLAYYLPERSGTACFKNRFFRNRYYIYRTAHGRLAARLAAWFMQQTRWIQLMQILLQLNWFGSKPAIARRTSAGDEMPSTSPTTSSLPPGRIHPNPPTCTDRYRGVPPGK